MRQHQAEDRFLVALVGILGAAVIVGHVLGATILQSTLWGTHAYGFLPRAALVVALLVTLALVIAAARLPEPAAGPETRRAGAARPALWGGLLALAAVLFWWFRIQHTLLGDSGPLSQNLPLGERTHPRQPLSAFVHYLAYGWARGLFEGPGRSPQEVGFDTAALDSVVAGVLFVPVAWFLARHLVGAARAGGEAAAAPGRADGMTAALATALLLTQGYVQLFFGYVENYTWFTLAIGLYLCAGMSHVAGRAPLALAGAALAVATGFNISGIVLWPSLAALGAWGLLRRERRIATVRDLAATVLIFLGLHLSLSALAGFNPREELRHLWDLYLVVQSEGADRSTRYLASWPHVREFVAVQALIGPFAGLLLLPAAAYRLARPGRKDARLLFMLTASLPPLAAAWTYGDSVQGIPRDWDAFAPFALPFTAAAIHCLASAPRGATSPRRLLAVASVISLFHTGAWVALNTSELRSLERYKTLPASKGRTEMVVGYWYLTHDQPGLARQWFERAIAAYPANNLAHHQLGLFAMDEMRYDDAIRHFETAVQARPVKGNYRLSLADALVMSGRPGEALPHLEFLTRLEPGSAELWACTGIVYSGIGRRAEARAALGRAASLAPGDPRYPRLIARLGDRDAFTRAVEEEWEALVLK